MKRVFLIVLDSFGIGEMPDASEYGDKGTNTLLSVSKSPYFSMENMKKAGKDQLWLARVLKEHDSTVSGTLLLTVDGGNNVVWIGKEYRK